MPATPAWPPRSAPRLFVEPPLADAQRRTIDGPQAHYLAQVMRRAVGDAVILLDNATGEWLARVENVGRRRVDLCVERRLRQREQAPDLWLCVAPIKKAHFDMVIEKATELGVGRIVPVLTRRCVVDKVNGERMAAIAREAAEQCARTALPDIAALVPLAVMLRNWPTDRRLFHADEQGGLPAIPQFQAHSGPAALLIGPEGGFDETERGALAAHASTTPVSLGPRILRAETAAITITGLWMAAAGDWSPQVGV